MMPDSIAAGWAVCADLPSFPVTCSGAARNQIGAKSYGRPGRYRRAGRFRSLPACDSAAITRMAATGMTTKIRTVLKTDNGNAPRRLNYR